MAILRTLVTSILFILFIHCKEKAEQNKSGEDNTGTNLVEKFENELQELDKQDFSLIDDATELFQEYIDKTNNKAQRDSLFQPYFNIYMSGREFLIHEENEVVEKYGFIKKNINGKATLNPLRSDYLQTKVITHLSSTMQEFCNQQLKEFNDDENLEIIAANTLWWEKFNKENPSFFLKEMTTYHYKNWHLKNLIRGTEAVPVFTNENSISKNALEVYNTILNTSPNTETANTLKTYLNTLKIHNMTRTDEVDEFINELN